MRNVIYQLILFLYTNSQDDVYALAARHILKNIDKIQDCSITDVADLCYVSPATISRLCRKLCFESFADFKNAITSEEHHQFKNRYYPTFHEDLDNQVDTSMILEHHFDSIQKTLKNTYDSLDIPNLKAICKLIHDSKRIIFIGYHTAQFASIQFQERLTYNGKECFGSLNINEQLNLIKNAKEDDLIILASLSGGFLVSNPNLIRHFKHSQSKKIVFANLEELIDVATLSINISGSSDTLITKFTLTYLYELLEMEYANLYQ